MSWQHVTLELYDEAKLPSCHDAWYMLKSLTACNSLSELHSKFVLQIGVGSELALR